MFYLFRPVTVAIQEPFKYIPLDEVRLAVRAMSGECAVLLFFNGRVISEPN